MAKYSLWNLLRSKGAIVVKMEKQVDIYSDYGRVKGAQYYIYQDGKLVEFRTAKKNHGHDKISWANVYNQQGEQIVENVSAEHSRMAGALMKIKYGLQRVFMRHSKRTAMAEAAFANHQAMENKRREERIAELARRNMEAYRAQQAAAAEEKRRQTLRAALYADLAARVRRVA